MPDGIPYPRLTIGIEAGLVRFALRPDLRGREAIDLHPDDAEAWAIALQVAARRARGDDEPEEPRWLGLLLADGREVEGGGYQRIPKPLRDAMVTFPPPLDEWGPIASYAEFDAEEGGNLIGRPTPIVVGQLCAVAPGESAGAMAACGEPDAES